MVLPHNLHAPVDMMRPEPVGICDRDGFLWPLSQLTWQFQWAGTNLVNQRILVCPVCLDTPAPFLQTFRFGPEPAPLPNARPWHYAYQNQGGEPPLDTVSQILPDEQGQP